MNISCIKRKGGVAMIVDKYIHATKNVLAVDIYY